jgi:hypothetical protein
METKLDRIRVDATDVEVTEEHDRLAAEHEVHMAELEHQVADDELRRPMAELTRTVDFEDGLDLSNYPGKEGDEFEQILPGVAIQKGCWVDPSVLEVPASGGTRPKQNEFEAAFTVAAPAAQAASARSNVPSEECNNLCHTGPGALCFQRRGCKLVATVLTVGNGQLHIVSAETAVPGRAVKGTEVTSLMTGTGAIIDHADDIHVINKPRRLRCLEAAGHRIACFGIHPILDVAFTAGDDGSIM